jgi:5'-deoxynucleotidase YfbR-like HD superfamily hydrolase
MALVHDLAESIVGDITPHQGVPKTEKHRMELVSLIVNPLHCVSCTVQEAMENIQSLVPDEVSRLVKGLLFWNLVFIVTQLLGWH